MRNSVDLRFARTPQLNRATSGRRLDIWRSLLLASTVVLLVMITVAGLMALHARKLSDAKADSHERLLQLYAKINLGMEQSEVQDILQAARLPEDWAVSSDARKEVLTVSSPLEWGATNWVLYLRFESDMLMEKRVKTLDNDDPPSGAPPEIQ